MYRYQRPFSIFARRFSRNSFPTKQHGDAQVQRVRFLRPIFRGRWLSKYMFWAVVINVIWLYVERRQKSEIEQKDEPVSVTEAVKQAQAAAQAEQVGGVGAERVSESEGKVGEAAQDESDDDEEDWEDDELVPEKQPEDAWFIPLWLARPRERELYTADDPEWQNFVKFDGDMKFRRAVKMSLMKYIHAHYGGRPDFQRLLGNPILVGKQWLEFYYPNGPPIEYDRLGIEITDDYVAILERPVDPRKVRRLQRVLYPQTALKALWDSSSTLGRMELARLKASWNPGEESNQSQSQALSNIQKMGQIGGKGDAASATKQEAASSTPSATDANKSERPLLSLLPDLPQPSKELSHAIGHFRSAYAHNTKMDLEPPRGALLVGGMIELVGSKRKTVLDVTAFFDPSQMAIIQVTVRPQPLRNRKLQSRRPSPKKED